MITYHNSGAAGREFSRIEVSKFEDTVEITGVQEKGYANIRLSREQVAHLRDALTKWLGDNKDKAPASPPMIEGDIL